MVKKISVLGTPLLRIAGPSVRYDQAVSMERSPVLSAATVASRRTEGCDSTVPQVPSPTGGME